MSTRHPPLRSGARRLVAVAGLAASLLSPVTAYAFQIVPIAQDFEPSGRGSSQTFQVENNRDEQVTVTIDTALRKVDIDGNETLAPTDDFTVFPTEIILQPKASQVVRAKFTGDPSPKAELAYRIIAEETPLNMKRDTPGASVFLTVRYVGSVYVVPKGAKADIVVASAKPVTGQKGQQLELILENKGTRHAIVDTPALTISAGGVTKPVDKDVVEKALSGENVLAQSQRRVLVPWPQGVPFGAVTADLKFNAVQ
jgi:fimbrial chaperone protein